MLYIIIWASGRLDLVDWIGIQRFACPIKSELKTVFAFASALLHWQDGSIRAKGGR